MNCKVLIDASPLEHWKRECITLLQDGNAVELCRVDAVERRSGPSIYRRWLGGRSLRTATAPNPSRPIGPFDLVLDLRANAAPDAARGETEYWFFCDGDGAMLGELPGARTIAHGSPCFTIELRARDDAGGFVALRSGTFKSLYTYARSMDVALAECKRWPALALKSRLALGRLPHSNRAAPSPAVSPPAPLSLMLRQARALIAHAYVHLFVDARWSVGLIRGTPGSFLSESYRPQIEWLRNPSAEFLADPFVFRSTGGRYVMGERIDRSTQTGFISCLEVEDGGRVVAERAIIRSQSHLSYPYVFEEGGTWYMVPESAQDRRVVLYRALDVPYKWERVATLIDGVAACDNTIVRHDGLWWLFCTHQSRDANLNLFLYHAPELLGPWTAHIANPVKTDIRSSRPAGTPFLANGVLYRPAQDCAKSYGDAIAFNRVTTLTEHAFAEETVSTFRRDERSKASRGAHTISYSDGLMAIDSKTIVFASPRVIRRRLGRLATRIVSAAT